LIERAFLFSSFVVFQDLLASPKRSKDTVLTQEEALKENTVFREKFPDWLEGGASLVVKQQANVEAKERQHKVYDRGACKLPFFPFFLKLLY